MTRRPTSRLLTGFPPIARPDAHMLILGSMPGDASLAANQYYAHPRNAFWPIMASLLGWKQLPDYESRTVALCEAGIALWDVVHGCRRIGSLDSAIDPATLRCNDFAGFYRAHRRIELVAFNGGMADRLYRTRVLPLGGAGSSLPLLRLPSTSPAHAGRTLAAKTADWQAALGPMLGPLSGVRHRH